jgi:hypothetical protein
LKKSVYEYAKAHRGTFPPLLKIQSIVADSTIKLFLSDNEEVDPMAKAEVQENINHFKWYWNILLGWCRLSGTKFWKAAPSITPLFPPERVQSPLKWRH